MVEFIRPQVPTTVEEKIKYTCTGRYKYFMFLPLVLEQPMTLTASSTAVGYQSGSIGVFSILTNTFYKKNCTYIFVPDRIEIINLLIHFPPCTYLLVPKYCIAQSPKYSAHNSHILPFFSHLFKIVSSVVDLCQQIQQVLPVTKRCNAPILVRTATLLSTSFENPTVQ